MTFHDAINLKSKCASETSTASTDTANGRGCCPPELISSHLGYLLSGNGLVLGSASHRCGTLGVLIHLVTILCQTNCSCSYKVLVHVVHSFHHFIYLHKHTVQLLYTPTFVCMQAHAFPKKFLVMPILTALELCNSTTVIITVHGQKLPLFWRAPVLTSRRLTNHRCELGSPRAVEKQLVVFCFSKRAVPNFVLIFVFRVFRKYRRTLIARFFWKPVRMPFKMPREMQWL